MATETNHPVEPEREPNAASPAGDANADADEPRAADTPRTMALPAEFVENLPPELLEGLPPEVRANLTTGGRLETHTSITSTSMMWLGRVVNPVADKVTEQHITDIIQISGREADYADRQSEREYSDRKHARNLATVLVAMVILALTAVAIILIYQDLLDFLERMSLIIIPALGGVGIGIAIGFRMGIRYANARGRQ